MKTNPWWGRLQPANPSKARTPLLLALLILAVFSSGCLKIPAYQRPSAAVPPHFKEAPPAGWKEAQPSDGVLRGKWWEIFKDPALNALEEQVNISNQNVLQAEAQFREARAAVRIARSALFPLVTATPSVAASQASGRLANRFGPTSPLGLYELPVNASYTVDLWGAVRASVNQSANTAQSTAAMLQNVRLLFQSELAQDYFQLHGLDGDIDLLNATVKSYQELLALTRNRYAGGIASDGDVAQAETQLYTAQAQLVDVGVQRAQLEHAIAVLVGKPPAELSIAHAPIQVPPPPIPVGLPSALLGTPPRRRRNRASGRRRQPGDRHRQGGILSHPDPRRHRRRSNRRVSSTGLPGPATSGPSDRNWPRPSSTPASAAPRWTRPRQATTPSPPTIVRPCLTAFQQVEDNLAALRILADESGVLDRAVSSAERSVTISTAQYKGGVASYIQVITVQAIALANQRAAIDVQTRRMTASVLLIEALGGGWNASQLPSIQDVSGR